MSNPNGFANIAIIKQVVDKLFKNDFEGTRDKLIFELFYQTGIRLSELLNLKESDVDSESIKVLGKRNKERLIPISRELFVLIENYRKLKYNCSTKNQYLLIQTFSIAETSTVIKTIYSEQR
jgi:integrase/recombinase XerC